MDNQIPQGNFDGEHVREVKVQLLKEPETIYEPLVLTRVINDALEEDCQGNHFGALSGLYMSDIIKFMSLKHLLVKLEHSSNMKLMENVKHVSSFVVSTIVFLGILSDICCSLLSITKVQHGHVSIWPSLLSLFGFMVFVWAVAVMILVQAPFTGMQCSMFAFWGILMNLRLANSISGAYVPILGIFIYHLGWQIMKASQMIQETEHRPIFKSI